MKTIEINNPSGHNQITKCSYVDHIESMKAYRNTMGSGNNDLVYIYATETSTEPFSNDNMIGMGRFSSGTLHTNVVAIDNGRGLSGKSYIGVSYLGSGSVTKVTIEYVPADTVKVYNGSTWKESVVNVNNGSSFDMCQIFRYDGTQWVECTH